MRSGPIPVVRAQADAHGLAVLNEPETKLTSNRKPGISAGHHNQSPPSLPSAGLALPSRDSGAFLFEGMTGTKRITGRRHGIIRDRVLSANPLCVMCQAEGRVRLATEVDHIIALTNGGAEHPHDDSNRQGLCFACHEIKTAADLGYTPKVETGLDGWPVEHTQQQSSTARWKRAQRG